MTEKFVVTGMTWRRLRRPRGKAAHSLDGVDSAAVNLMLGTLVCSYDADKVTPQAIFRSGGVGLRRGSGGPRPSATSAGSRRHPPGLWAAGFCGPWCVWCPCSISAWVT